MKMIFFKLSSKCQTVISHAVRERLNLSPGDQLAYAMTEKGIVIKKAQVAIEDDPFAVFSEWSAAADEEAYADL